MVEMMGLESLRFAQALYVVRMRALLIKCHTVAFNPHGFKSHLQYQASACLLC